MKKPVKITQLIGAELIIDNGGLKIVKITAPEASSVLCSGTQWCVANEETAQEYLEDGPLYLFYVGGERKYLAHIESGQFMDVYDVPVGEDIKWRLIEVLEPEIGPISGIPSLAYYYAKNVIGDRWSEGESAIAKDAELAYYYARSIIKDRWPEVEPVIMKDPYLAYYYAKDVIGGRWPEAEPEIANMSEEDTELAYNYAKDVIGGRWPEAEPEIAKDIKWAYMYAKSIIEDRWPEVEPAIMKDPYLAYYYAKDVIGGRWPEAEPEIAKDVRWTSAYVRDVIGLGVRQQ
jgi:hypothetical protein